MAIAYINSAKALNNTVATTGSLDTTGATLLVVVLAYYSGDPPTLTDNKGNTWTPLTEYTTGFDVANRIYYCANPTVGAGHTFTGTSVSFGLIFLAVSSFSGVSTTSPFDVQNGNQTTSIVSSISTGSVTPSEDNELVIIGVGSSATLGPYTANGGFTVVQYNVNSYPTNYGGGLGYLIQTTAAAANPTWTFGGNSAYTVASIATFKEPGGGGGIFTPLNAIRAGHQGW